MDQIKALDQTYSQKDTLHFTVKCFSECFQFLFPTKALNWNSFHIRSCLSALRYGFPFRRDIELPHPKGRRNREGRGERGKGEPPTFQFWGRGGGKGSTAPLSSFGTSFNPISTRELYIMPIILIHAPPPIFRPPDSPASYIQCVMQ